MFPRRMLLVEDDDKIARAWQRSFNGDGWEVMAVSTLEQAREALEDEAGIDVVLLDVKLPDGRGVDLVPELNAMYPRPRIVILSAVLDASIALDVFGQVDVLVPKPVSTAVLRGLVAEVSRDVSRKHIEHFADMHKLSPNEKQGLILAANGADNTALCKKLQCQRATIATYWKRILSKTNCNAQRDVFVKLWRYSLQGRRNPAKLASEVRT